MTASAPINQAPVPSPQNLESLPIEQRLAGRLTELRTTWTQEGSMSIGFAPVLDPNTDLLPAMETHASDIDAVIESNVLNEQLAHEKKN